MVKNHICISIGINQYEFFSPLNYAQQDAVAFFNFFAKELPRDTAKSLLMTDSSPPFEQISTYPNAENICFLLQQFCRENVQKGDLLWFFFSGYGVTHQGQDYLMPVNGHPQDIVKTGLAMADVFRVLKTSAAQMVVVLLDISRAAASNGAEVVGIDTLTLAKESAIPTILSCEPGQFSREAWSLQHGLFTACLLDGLRYHSCLNLESLSEYLKERLPQLCEHHQLPIQSPSISLYPPEIAQRLIWPQKETPLASTSVNGSQERFLQNGSSDNGTVVTAWPINNNSASADLSVAHRPSVEVNNNISSQSVASSSETAPQQHRFSLLWPFLGLLVLLGGVWVGRNLFNSQPNIADSPTSLETPTPKPAPPVASSPSNRPVALTPTKTPQQPPSSNSQKLIDQAVLLVEPVQASRFSSAIAKVSTISPQDPLYPQAQQNIDRWSAVIFDIAKARSKQGNFSGAIAAAQLVPKNRPALKTQAETAISQWQRQLKQQQANQQRLRQAQASVRWGVLDSYIRAIASAQTIKPGEPEYFNAQTLIGRWSQGIYEIASYRGSRGWYLAAIKAASAIPKEAPVYTQAQEAIQKWQRLGNLR